MSDDAVKTFTGWKLDLMRAVRADRKTSPGAACCFAALMDHVNQETRLAWPSEAMLGILLGCSVKAVRKYLANLVDAKWIMPQGRSPRGTTIYLVQDYRMNQALDQIAIELDRHREKEARRQAARRARVTEHGVRPETGVSHTTGSSLSRNTGLDEHLQEHLHPVSSEGEASSFREKINSYAKAKGRAAA